MAPLIVISLDESEVRPGEEVVGKVLVSNDKPRKCGGISLKFKGYAEVQCNRANPHSEVQNLSAQETYYKTKLQLWQDKSHVLEAGKHSFPISFRLPANVPASFQSSSGKVEHVCKARMKLKQSFDAKSKKAFTVLSKQYAGYEALLMKPQLRCDDSLSGKGSKIVAKVEIDGTFYAPGDHIIIDADVSNESAKKIRSSAVFYMEVQYMMRGARRTERYALNKIERPDIHPEETDSWVQEKIEVPVVPTTGLDGCNIITISYGVEFAVSRKLPDTSLQLDFPIVVGLDETSPRHSSWVPELSDNLRLDHRDSIISRQSDDSFDFKPVDQRRLARKDLEHVIRSAPASRSSSRQKRLSVESHHSFFKSNFLSPASLSNGSLTSLGSGKN